METVNTEALAKYQEICNDAYLEYDSAHAKFKKTRNDALVEYEKACVTPTAETSSAKAEFDYRNAPQSTGNSIIEGARFYKTAKIAQDIPPFIAGETVAVRYMRTVFNHHYQQDEDLFFVWAGAGDKYPSELFARALKDFAL